MPAQHGIGVSRIFQQTAPLRFYYVPIYGTGVPPVNVDIRYGELRTRWALNTLMLGRMNIMALRNNVAFAEGISKRVGRSITTKPIRDRWTLGVLSTRVPLTITLGALRNRWNLKRLRKS